MANKNNEMTPKRTTPTGFKMRSGANNKAVSPTTEVVGVRDPEQIKRQRGIILTVIAAILIVAIVAAITTSIILAIIKGESVDYLKDNLSKYISISKDEYTNIEVDIPLMEYDEAMLTAEINRLLVEHKSTTPEADGTGIVSKPITLGDIVNIRYRIYTVDANGKESEVDGWCNFNDTQFDKVEVGSQRSAFLGFEEKLIGIIPGEQQPFQKIKAGEVSDGDVIYLTYRAYSEKNPGISGSYKRIDLSRDDIDEEYGVGFKDFLVGQKIGEALETKNFKLGESSIGYHDWKVEFTTQCEANCLTFDITFPENYTDSIGGGKELRGLDAKIDVYLDSCEIYDTPEYNEEFITKTLGMSAESLASYEGADLVAKHKAYIKAYILKEIDKTNESLVGEAIWDVITTKGTVIKYPKEEYERIYDSYMQEIEAYYQQYGEERGYESVDEAAIAYYGLKSGSDWQAHLKGIVEGEVKKDLVLYYIIRKEGFLPSKEEYDKEYNSILEEYMEYYLNKHKDEFDKFEGDEYDAQYDILKNEIIGAFNPKINYEVYKNILLRKMVENGLATVK